MSATHAAVSHARCIHLAADADTVGFACVQEEYLEMLQQVTAPNARSCMLNRPGVKPVNSLRTTLNRIHFLLEAEVDLMKLIS